MKIEDLIPAELPRIVIRTIIGRLTEADRLYLKEECNIEDPVLWFGSGDSEPPRAIREVDLEINDGEQVLHLDTSEAWDGRWFLGATYAEEAYLTLLTTATMQLPLWVFNRAHFKLEGANLSFCPDSFAIDYRNLSLNEFKVAYENAWDFVFDNGDLVVGLSNDIYRQMITGADPVPRWIWDSQGPESFHIPLSVLEKLEILYEEHVEASKASALEELETLDRDHSETYKTYHSHDLSDNDMTALAQHIQAILRESLDNEDLFDKSELSALQCAVAAGMQRALDEKVDEHTIAKVETPTYISPFTGEER